MTRLVYLIAGEESGDIIGAQLMKAMKSMEPYTVFTGIGGARMREQGLESLFSMEDLSVMGLAEILPKIPHLLGRIHQTIVDIKAKTPDILLTIDAPDFSFRVQKAIRQSGMSRIRQVHYVAPTVWAWRAGRAKKIAKFLDGLICLFDFEPPYFQAEGLDAIAVGHPVMESGIVEAKSALIGDDRMIRLGLFLGSRRGELKRTAPVILEAVSALRRERNDFELIVPTLPHLLEQVTESLAPLECPMTITADRAKKWNIFKACDMAVAVSGTVGLELAVADVPHIIAYRAAPLTAFIARRMIRTPFAHLVNIMLQKLAVPELLQEECTGERLKKELQIMLDNQSVSDLQRLHFQDVRKRMGTDIPPSQKAAEYLLLVRYNA